MKYLVRRYCILLMVLQLVLLQPALAQQSNLDLSSTERTEAAQGAFSSASLQIGQDTRTVNPGDLLTPAENIALQQVLGSGQQNLLLNNLGAAVGGAFQVSQQMTGIQNFVVPQGVTALQDAAAISNLNLSGNFANAGNFYTFSSNAGVTSASISALNIFNQQGALLSTALPANLSSFGIAGLTNAASVINLQLNAINNIVNSGSIVSSGNLTAVSGGSIINALPAGVTGLSPVMQAMNTVNLISNNISNSGIINSQLANINIAGMTASNLLINNIGGRMEAMVGAINVRDQLFTTKHDLNILGGDLISQELNLFSGDGIVNMNVQEVSGLINVNAGIAHLKAATPLMQIGNISLTGDPTFYNSLGDLSVGDLNFSGQDLALVASGNIVVNGTIKTAGTAGGDVLVFAGAKFEDDFSGSQLPDEPYQSSTIRVIGVFEGRTISIFDTNGISIDSTGSGGDGGNVTLVADGHISVANRIVTGGAENSGNVTVISKTGINVRDIDTSGNLPPGGITTGNISLLTYQPSIKSGILEVTNGTIINSGGFDTTSRGLVSATGTISADDLKTSGGGIFLRAGDTIEVDNVRASSPDLGGFIVIEAHQVTDSANPFIVGASATDDGVRGVVESTGAFGGGISISSDATGGITIESWNNITVAASGGVGGEISVSANNGPLNIGGGTIDLNGVGSGGGEFSLQSASTLTITNNLVVNVNGDGDSSGGDINIQAATLNLQGSLTTNLNSSGSGDGGDISIDGISGVLQITGPGSLTINANSAGEGSGGVIEIEANFNMGGDISLKADGGMFGGEITVDTNVLTAGNITITADQGLTEAFRGFGGEIDITNNNGRDISITTGALVLSANTVDHTAGDIIIEAANLNIDAGSISIGANATGNGNGGFVSLEADKFVATSVISLSANGSGTGFGGEVDVYTYGAEGDIAVGSGAGQVQVSVTGGSVGSESGDAGLVFLSAARNLTVDVDAINAVPLGDNGTGAWLTFESGTSGAGILNVNGAIVADGVGNGDGGRITIISNDPSQELTVSADTMSLQISAKGGAINSIAGNGGIISLKAKNNIFIDGSSISAVASGNNGNGGTILLSATQGNIELKGNIELAGKGNSNGGVLGLEATFGNVTIGAISANAQLIITGGKENTDDTGSNIVINAGNDVTVFGTIDASATHGDKLGGTINIITGSSSIGTAKIIGELTANSFGNGDGGQISITINSPGMLHIKGIITADSPGLGHSGELLFKNVADADFKITLSGLVSATSLGGGISATQFYDTARGLYIFTEENATFRGPISARGSDISIVSGLPFFELEVSSLVALNGSIAIDIPANGTKVTVLTEASQILAKQNISIKTSELINNGNIQSVNGSLDIRSNSILNTTSGSTLKALTNMTLGTKALTNNGSITVMGLAGGIGELQFNLTSDFSLSGSGSISNVTGSTIFLAQSNNINVNISGNHIITGFSEYTTSFTYAEDSTPLAVINLSGSSKLITNNSLVVKSKSLTLGANSNVEAQNIVLQYTNSIANFGAIESKSDIDIHTYTTTSAITTEDMAFSGAGTIKASGIIQIHARQINDIGEELSLGINKLEITDTLQLQSTKVEITALHMFLKNNASLLLQTDSAKLSTLSINLGQGAKISKALNLVIYASDISSFGTVELITNLHMTAFKDSTVEGQVIPGSIRIIGNGRFAATNSLSVSDNNKIGSLLGLGIEGEVTFNSSSLQLLASSISIAASSMLNLPAGGSITTNFLVNAGMLNAHGSALNVTSTESGFVSLPLSISNGLGSGKIDAEAINVSNLRGAIHIEQDSINGILHLEASRDILMTTQTGDLNFAQLVTGFRSNLGPTGGSITVAHSGTVINLINATVYAQGGNILLVNTNPGGRIFVGTHTTIVATSRNASIPASADMGAVRIFAAPANAVFTGIVQVPQSITKDGLTQGKIKFGDTGITIPSFPQHIKMVSNGGALEIFAPTGSIELQDNIEIFADNPSQISKGINNLDFRNQTTVSTLIQMQQLGLVGGSLVAGDTISGDVILENENIIDILSALNINEGIRIIFKNIDPINVIQIQTDSDPAVVGGTIEFLSTSAEQQSNTIKIEGINSHNSLTILPSGEIISNKSLVIKAANTVNNGNISAVDNLLLSSDSGMLIAGTGIFSGKVISLSTTNNTRMVFDGQITVRPASFGSFNLNYDPISNSLSFAQLSFTAGSILTVQNGASIFISSSEIQMADQSVMQAIGASNISWYSGVQSKILRVDDNATGRIVTTGGSIDFGMLSRTPIIFTKNAGSGAGIIQLLGGPLTTFTSQGGSVTIDLGVIINTNSNITFNIHDGGTFINNGTIQSSANGGRIIIDAFAYPITLTGSGTTKFTGTNGAFFVLTAGLGSINVNSSQNFDFSGYGGFVSFQADRLNLMPGIQVNALNGGAFEFIGNTLNMGAQSSINTTVTSGIAISITAPNVLLPADSFATMSSLGGDIIFTPRELAFTKAGGTETTLNLLGGKLITSSSVGPTLIDTGVTLASDNNISMQVFGSNQLILNGNITTSAPGASILITSSPIVTLTGTPASISATGGGNSTITIIGYDNGLNINSSYSLDAGSDGIVHLRAPDGVMTIASGVNVTINGGSQLVIATASLVMEANSKITVDKSTGTALAWGAEAHRSLKLSGPSGSSATIETTGGDIDIFGAGTGLPFTISKMPNSGETTLNLNGGNVTLSALDTSLTIESGVTVASDKNLLVSLTGSTFNNQGTLSLSNGGSLSINADAQSTIVNMGAIAINGGNMNVSSASDIVINDTIAMTGAGSLNISTLAGSNADIVINANIGGSASTNLTADGSGNIVQNGGVISGASVNLTSGSGNIGSEGQNITTNATILTANTTGIGSVYLTNNGSVDVGNSSAGETFQLTAVGNIKTLGIVSANNVVLQAAPGSGGGVFADPDIIGTTSITIRADGAGTITQLPGIRLRAPTVILESQDGDIGTTTTSIKTVADTLIVRTGATASAYVSEMDNVALGASSVGQTFRLRAKGDITVVGNVAANDVRLITTSPTGAIVVAATITGTSNVTLRTKDSGNVSIDQTSSVTTNNGSVLIRANDLKLDGTINAGTGQVTLRANGNKTMAVADIADANGNDAVFDVNALELSKITADTLVIGDKQNTAGLVIQGNMNVSGTGAGNFDLTFRSGGDYAATSIAINLRDRSLDVNVDGSVSSGTVSANLGDIKLVSGNGITVAGALTTTGNVTLNTSIDGNGDIVLQANVTSGGNLKLTAHGTGAITQTAGTLTANNLHLTADNGNIGESSQPLTTNATKLFANTLGSVYVSEFDDLVMGNSSAGGNFSVVAGGAITVNNVLTQNGSILVSAGSGTLTVGGQSVIFANEGNLHLQNRNTTSGAIVIGKDSILGANSASDTSLGNVYITIGDIPSSPTAGTAPAKVTVINANGGQAYFDTTSITTQGAQSIVNVNGRTVLFETGGLGAGSIKLKGDVNISAGLPLEPIAFVHSTNAVKNANNQMFSSYTIPVWTSRKSELLEIKPGDFVLVQGQILIHATKKCIIKAGPYVVSISKESICLINLDSDQLTVRNLHEEQLRSTIVNVSKDNLVVPIGTECIFSENPNIQSTASLESSIGHRRVSKMRLAQHLYCIKSEFSPISLMQNSALLNKTMNTKTGLEQIVRAKLVKTAACLMSIPSNNAPFTKN